MNPDQLLAKRKKTQPTDDELNAIIDTGFDELPPDHLASEKRKKRIESEKKQKATRDFSVPMNDYYFRKLQEIADALSKMVGAHVGRRPIAENALRAFIDKKCKELNI